MSLLLVWLKTMHILQIFFPYYNLTFAFQQFLERFSFQLKLHGLLFFSPLSRWWWTPHYSSSAYVMFDFHFPSDSCSVPFENPFWRICKRRLPIHKANIFTNGLVKSHCRQIQAALWIPTVFHFDSGIQFFKTPPQALLPLFQHWLILRPSVVFFLSTLCCSPLTEPFFLTHLSDFRPILSWFLLCSLMFSRWPPGTSTGICLEILKLWKTHQLWCV